MIMDVASQEAESPWLGVIAQKNYSNRKRKKKGNYERLPLPCVASRGGEKVTE